MVRGRGPNKKTIKYYHSYQNVYPHRQNGIEPGTAFADLPDDWTCPECGVGKDMFEPQS